MQIHSSLLHQDPTCEYPQLQISVTKLQVSATALCGWVMTLLSFASWALCHGVPLAEWTTERERGALVYRFAMCADEREEETNMRLAIIR